MSFVGGSDDGGVRRGELFSYLSQNLFGMPHPWSLSGLLHPVHRGVLFVSSSVLVLLLLLVAIAKLHTVVKENARTPETSALIAGKYQVVSLALEILDKRLSCWVIPCEYLNSCRVAIGFR